jgi:hypothetical protein
MNVQLPFGLGVDQPEPSHTAFWIVVGLSALALCGFMIFWRYKKW